MRGIPAGATSRVEDGAGGQGVQDLVHDGFVEVEQAVARLVVGVGPLAVCRHRVTAADVHPGVGGERRVVEQSAHLGEARLHEVLVEVAGPSAQQRDALESEQVGQRVLVDHAEGP